MGWKACLVYAFGLNMKSLDLYIQEKYLIDIDSEDDLEDPITCDLNEFCKWLKYKYDIDNKTIDEIESKFIKI